MKFEKHIPAAVLQPYVQSFMILQSEDGMVNRILPGTSLVMVFRYKGSVALREENGIKDHVSATSLTGLRESVRFVDYEKNTETLLVVFHEGGAAAFVRQPLHELFGSSIPLDEFIPSQTIRDLEDKLAEADGSLKRIALVEKFLISLLDKYQTDQLIMQSIEKIRSANGNLRIKELVKELHISQDSFEKRFRKIIGTSPKKFSSIVRLKNLIEHHSDEDSLTGIAYEAGYFDQAHFIKDFKTFTGQTPLDFFKTSAYW